MIEDETNPELDSLFEDDPGSLAEIGEEDADDLNISNIATKIWLVKVLWQALIAKCIIKDLPLNSTC
jgi:hypothetical protein